MHKNTIVLWNFCNIGNETVLIQIQGHDEYGT